MSRTQAAAPTLLRACSSDAAWADATAAGPAGDDAGHGDGRTRGWGLLALSFSALGIIYGDIGTSPLYSYQAVFTGPPTPSRVLSAASLFFWTLTLIVLVKYVCIILCFDDNGEGGTFALYSLVCRAAGFNAYGKAQPEELQLAGLVGALPSWLKKQGRWYSVINGGGEPLRRLYARSRAAQVSLLLTVMMATAMVVGDGVLTPSISVMSAVSGLKVAFPALQQGEIVGATIAVLVILFSVQYLGTGKIAGVFAPVIAVWLLFNASLGLYNLSAHGWGIWQALLPHHAVAAFTGPDGFAAGWRLLAGVMLAITGAEAMFADLGHFNQRAVTVSFCGFVYPCLVVTYMGQAAFMTKNPQAFDDPFWNSVPRGAFWPMLVVATAASVVASQALISGVFSIMRQAMNLGVFPPMALTHTDEAAEGQIYIGAINFWLCIGCIAMVAGFQDTTALGHAYGVAVMSVMFITSILAAIVMLVCFGINPILVALFLAFFVPLEGLFLSSNITKIPEGGWVTIAIACAVASIKLVWWHGTAIKARYYKAQAAKSRGALAMLPGTGLAAGAAGAAPGQAGGGSAVGRPLLTTSADAHAGGSRTSTALARVTSSPLQPAAAAAAAAGVGVGPNGDGRGSLRVSLQSHSFSAVPSSVKDAEVVTFNNEPLARLPGMAIIYTQTVSGLPAVLQHLLVCMPAVYNVTVLLTVRIISRPYAYRQEERFLVHRSKQLAGAFRVIARYGYMEGVDHGPAFVRQLTTCLVRFVAQEGQRQQPRPPAGAAAAAGELQSGAGGEAAVIEMPRLRAQAAGPPRQPQQADGDEEDEERGVAAARGGAGAGAGEGSGLSSSGRGLGRWSRVPVAAADEGVLEEALAATGAAPDLAARSVSRALSRALSRGATAQPEAPKDGGAGGSLPQASGGGAAPAAAAMLALGRESLNRRQYAQLQQQQRTAAAAARRRASGDEGARRLAVSSPPGIATIPADRPLSLRAAPAAAGGGPVVGGGGGGGGGGGSVTGGGLDAAALRDVELLLRCYRQRTVYVMGRSQLAGRPKRSGKAAAAGSDEDKGSDYDGARPGGPCCAAAAGALARAGAGVRGFLRGLVMGAYRLLAINTHPPSQAWELPDDQLLLVSMVVRI